MTASPPRFEFRVWGEDLEEPAGRIRSLSDSHDLIESSEWYFVIAGVDDVNPKVRADVLDVKVLLRAVEGFEQWDPWLKVALPIGAAELTEQLFPRLRVPAPDLDRDVYSLAELVHEIAGPHPDLAPVEVAKRREIRRWGGCILEVAVVRIAGRDHHTAAIESVDIEALGDLRSRLHLEGRGNVSYPRAIKAALGMVGS